jgi:uncharacterized membrane-anchored protein YhcB (DUF1043 family)
MDSDVALIIGLVAGIAVGGIIVYLVTRSTSNQKVVISRNAQGLIDAIIET